jgi:hypothetical protein
MHLRQCVTLSFNKTLNRKILSCHFFLRQETTHNGYILKSSKIFEGEGVSERDSYFHELSFLIFLPFDILIILVFDIFAFLPFSIYLLLYPACLEQERRSNGDDVFLLIACTFDLNIFFFLTDKRSSKEQRNH